MNRYTDFVLKKYHYMLIATDYEGPVVGSICSFRGHLFACLIGGRDLRFLIVELTSFFVYVVNRARISSCPTCVLIRIGFSQSLLRMGHS